MSSLIKLIHKVSILMLFFLIGFSSSGQSYDHNAEVVPRTVEVLYTDDDIEEFVEVIMDIAVLQIEAEIEMVEAIENAGMDIETFNLYLYLMEQTPDIQFDDLTAEEQKSFQKAISDVMVIQKNLEEKALSVIEEADMSLDRYTELVMAYQQDEAFKNRVNAKFEEAEKSTKR